MVALSPSPYPMTTVHGYESHSWVAGDGTRLVYHTVGDGPVVVAANGIGGTFHALRHLYRHLARRHRIISWDYRALHASERPQDPRAVLVEDNAADLEGLLDHLGVRRALFVGWSMGVQVNFELYRRRPELFAGIAAFNGTAGHAFASMRRSLATRLLVNTILRLMERHGAPLGAAARAATTTPTIVHLMRSVGLLAPTVDVEVFFDLVHDYACLDFEQYGIILAALDLHSAWDVLPTVRVPTSVVVGDRDFMTPVGVAHRICDAIAGSELTVLRGATHFAPIEQPRAFNDALDRLLARTKLGA